MDSKHTATPWKIGNESGNEGEAVYIESEDRDIAVTMATYNLDGDAYSVEGEDIDNAAFIVKACNEHEGLTLLVCDLMDALENSISLKSGEFFGLRERFRDLIQGS